MRTKQFFELIGIICYSRLNGNILNAGQCIMLHQYNNGITNKMSIDLKQKVNFIKQQIQHQNWERPYIAYDGDKTLQIKY